MAGCPAPARGNVCDGLQEPSVVGQIDPLEGGNSTAPKLRHGPAVDHLALVKAVDGSGESVVIGSPTLPTDSFAPTSARHGAGAPATYRPLWLAG